jgi:hypothetical protein
MIIRSVRHRGLLRLIEDDDSRELRNDLVRRLRNILAVLIAADRHQRRCRAARLARSPVEGRPRRHMEHFGQRQLAADLRHPAG